MKPGTLTKLTKTVKQISGQVHPRTAQKTIEAIAAQVEIAEEARRRIEEEGIVVRDMKGSVIPHPAIKVEADASKMATDLLLKNKKMI